ncbi:MAG TPA: hypothetical protein VEX41_08880 [Candidatus Eisenbacteria bacterium]|nr:hypothetical protein [Candidatus Eisenbacteria bacterium]
MDAIAALTFFGLSMGLFGLLGAAAALWGADSRPTIGDDHAR